MSPYSLQISHIPQSNQRASGAQTFRWYDGQWYSLWPPPCLPHMFGELKLFQSSLSFMIASPALGLCNESKFASKSDLYFYHFFLGFLVSASEQWAVSVIASWERRGKNRSLRCHWDNRGEDLKSHTYNNPVLCFLISSAGELSFSASFLSNT